MKKIITASFVGLSLMATAFVGNVKEASAQSFDVKQLVQLLIALDVIAPDKINLARAFVGLPPIEENASSTPSEESSLLASTTLQQVVQTMDTPKITIAGSMVNGEFVIPLEVEGSGWSKVYYHFSRGSSGQGGYIYPDSEPSEKKFIVLPGWFGDYDWTYTIYSGTGKDNTVGGKVVSSDSGTIHVGQ